MSRYIPDIASRRWVIVSPGRTHRPDENHNGGDANVCHFCPGNEHLTSPEVYRIGEGEKDEPGWKVRVIPNKYPITDFHEVIIHTPLDDKDIETLPLADVALIFHAYRARYNFYKDKGKVLIFCNKGEHAGASIPHAHSQLVVIPNQINLDELSREPLNSIIDENKFFNVYCPDFSQWPYEVWFAPKKDGKTYGDVTDVEIADLAEIMQRILQRIHVLYEEKKNQHIFYVPFGYNYYIHPLDNWYLRVIPRFVHRAGFELGTGLSVNIIDPIDAAAELKGETGRISQVLDKLKSY